MVVRLNQAPYLVEVADDLVVRMETVDSLEFHETGDGEFVQVIRLTGVVQYRPDGVSVPEAVGVTIGALLNTEPEDDVEGRTVEWEPIEDA